MAQLSRYNVYRHGELIGHVAAKCVSAAELAAVQEYGKGVLGGEGLTVASGAFDFGLSRYSAEAHDVSVDEERGS